MPFPVYAEVYKITSPGSQLRYLYAQQAARSWNQEDYKALIENKPHNSMLTQETSNELLADLLCASQGIELKPGLESPFKAGANICGYHAHGAHRKCYKERLAKQ